MNKQKAIHCWVTGRVQGVYFRAYTQKQAKALGLTGWVKNLSDGRVELFACGDEQKLEALYQWLWIGSPQAKVIDVERQFVPWMEMKGFEVTG